MDRIYYEFQVKLVENDYMILKNDRKTTIDSIDFMALFCIIFRKWYFRNQNSLHLPTLITFQIRFSYQFT